MGEAVVGELAVDLVGQDRDVRPVREAGDEPVDLLARRHAAGRVGGRIEDQEPGPRREQRERLLGREGEAVFLPHRAPARAVAPVNSIIER